MRLVQILLPTSDNDGVPFPATLFAQVRRELTDACGGVTAYMRAPATGLWDEGDEIVRDDVVIYEAMVEALDLEWWRAYRTRLEERFRQDEIVVRALPIERI